MSLREYYLQILSVLLLFVLVWRNRANLGEHFEFRSHSYCDLCHAATLVVDEKVKCVIYALFGTNGSYWAQTGRKLRLSSSIGPSSVHIRKPLN